MDEQGTYQDGFRDGVYAVFWNFVKEIFKLADEPSKHVDETTAHHRARNLMYTFAICHKTLLGDESNIPIEQFLINSIYTPHG